MSCSNCALTVSKYLEKEGLQNVRVSFISGDLSFDSPEQVDPQQIRKGIRGLGYSVIREEDAGKEAAKEPMNKHLRYLLICLPFTLVLLLHMLGDAVTPHWLMIPWVQLLICLPVYITGMEFFGRSAVNSILNGLPNMNVLIAIGATASFLYSLTGTLFGLGPDYLFYETTASIITLVFLGYYLEDASMQATQKALNGLARSQKLMANMIAFDEAHQEIIFPVENTQLRSGDLILIKAGEQVPADCKILWGEAGVNESIITGESLPLDRKAKDLLIGGSLLVSGTVKAQVTKGPKDSVLSGILNLVRQAQGEKPPIQQLADRISAVFVPAVLIITLAAFAANYLVLHALTPSLMRAIAILVIACPCAMGLATPAAIAVGLGRAARQGILFRNARSLQSFKDIRQVVFDKTGTLTKGELTISGWGLQEDAAGGVHAGEDAAGAGDRRAVPGGAVSAEEFKRIVYSLEKYSNHPIAACIAREWKQPGDLRWAKIEEIKGEGMRAATKEGDVYRAGSYKIAASLTKDDTHHVYILRNEQLLGWIDTSDTLRPQAAAIVAWLHGQGIRTFLLSGDREAVCRRLAEQVGITDIFSEQTPQQKMEKIAALNAVAPTAMVGDGINDAPAMAKATLGIAMSDASHIALQTADVVLVNQGLKQLPAALGLGRHTYATIRQNLFWAFFYNIIAIPIAGFGLLTPTFAALVMGFSDVVLAVNSVRLFVKKVV